MRLKSALERRRRKGGGGRQFRTTADSKREGNVANNKFRDSKPRSNDSPFIVQGLNVLCVIGAVESGGESEGEEGGGEEGRGQSLAVQQHQLEAEKEALLHNTGLVQEVRKLGGVVVVL